MSLSEIQITAMKIDDVVVTIQDLPTIELTAPSDPNIHVIAAGNMGPQGPQGKWVSMSQAQYDALSPKDPDTLYVIV